jgi:hypothetical protein
MLDPDPDEMKADPQPCPGGPKTYRSGSLDYLSFEFHKLFNIPYNDDLTALSEEELELLVALDDEGVEGLQVGRLVGESLLAGGELEDLGDVGEVAPLVAVQVVVRLLFHHVEPNKKFYFKNYKKSPVTRELSL